MVSQRTSAKETEHEKPDERFTGEDPKRNRLAGGLQHVADPGVDWVTDGWAWDRSGWTKCSYFVTFGGVYTYSQC